MSAEHQVSPTPSMIHSVDVNLSATAMPLAASVLLPVVPAPARRIVSAVMAMVTTPAAFWLTNTRRVPIG